MGVDREFSDRDDVEVEVLEALADRQEEGMTVFELRTRVEVDIDSLEGALGELKRDDLIEVNADGNRTVIIPDESVVTQETDETERGLFDELRRRLPF